LALGQVIVRELKLDNRGAVLQRWLAHHLAEVMAEAEQAVGPAKRVAEQQAVDIILKLWMHRRVLPGQVDPLGGFKDAIQVLGRLMPEANPWARLRRHGPYEDLLQEMFEAMCQVVLGGVLITQVKHNRSISEPELNLLEREEALLAEVLRQWKPFFIEPKKIPKIDIVYVDPNAPEETAKLNVEPEVSDQELSPEQHAMRDDVSAHETVTANLEQMQRKLANLITRWKNASPDKDELDEDDSTS
jgi:hypothetical protein